MASIRPVPLSVKDPELIAYLQNLSLQVFTEGNIPGSAIEARSITADRIMAGTITANEVAFSVAGGSGNFVMRSATEPTVRSDSSALVAGDWWIDTDDGDKPYTWDGSAWQRAYTEIDGGDITTGTLDANRIAADSITADKINVATLAAISAALGTITAGLLRDAGSTFQVDLDNALLTITDTQASPVTRIRIGKLDTGAEDYGIEVYDSSGNTILDASGLGVATVGWSQMRQRGHNLLENPGFELGDVGWGTFGGGYTIVNDPTNARTGNYVCKYQSDGSGGPNLVPAGLTYFVQPDEQLYLSAWFYTPAGSGSMSLGVRWYDGDGVQISRVAAASVSAASASSYVQGSGFVTAPANAVYARFDIGENTSDNSLTPWYIDDCTMLRAVTTDAVATAAITTAKIDDLAVTNAKIASLDAAKITTGTLDADRIGATSITAGKLNVTTLSSITANIGTLTAGLLNNAASSPTAGIRLDASSTKPGTWTRYLDLAATSTSPFLQHPAMSLNADGSATFSGTVAATTFTATTALFTGGVNVYSGSYPTTSIRLGSSSIAYWATSGAMTSSLTFGATAEFDVPLYAEGFFDSTVVSHRRYKDAIEDFVFNPDALLGLRPRRWIYSDESPKPVRGTLGAGFVADEVPAIFAAPNGEGYKAERIIAQLVGGWQDHEKRIAALEALLG